MSDRPTFSISTAIPYANGAPHIGHAYELIATDAVGRFKAIDGYDTLTMTGMDEHGQKMQQTAARLDITPQQLADRTAAQFEAMAELIGAHVDERVRTTQPRHTLATQTIWRRMREAGDIYLSTYAGWYSVRDEAFFAEDELTIDAAGTKRAPGGAPVEWVEEESYYFKLSAYAEPLLAHYRAHPEFIVPEKYRNEVVAFVERGLNDLSISRSTFDWGIPVPDDPKHVMYVWVDALTNYLTGTGWPDAGADNARFWPMDVHMIGKDITRFHCIFWPAFLMSAKVALPKQVVVHGFLFNKGEKMSKSVGNVITPAALAETYGADQIRYFFLREVPFGQDGNYTHEAIVNRINADLANDLGNLAQRSLSMIAKNCEGRVPEAGALTAADAALLRDARAPAGDGAPADGPVRAPSRARRDLEGGGRRQPLFRGGGAVGQEEDRPRAHGDRAAGDGRGRAHRRDPRPTVHARRHGAHAGRARRRAAGSHDCGHRRGVRPHRRRGHAGADAGLPALYRERGDRLSR